MIHEVTGDILLTKAHAIAHGVAPNDDFKNGLAFSLREQWPAMAKDYRHWCHTTNPKPGEAWTWAGVGGTHIVCLLTQEAPSHDGGRPGRAHVEHVNHALRALHKVVADEKLTSVAIPRLATGVGGLDWAVVQPLIEKHLSDLGIPVYVYAHYHKGVQASEPGVA
jgi:O-acetyl-ADP-ribose deacetylase (regulator of RNase III)